MGRNSISQPDGFAAELNAYLTYLIAANGRTDLSGRWLTTITDGARARDYWSKLVKNEAAMNTNDIDILAAAFNTDPFTFVSNAREHARTQAGPALHAVDSNVVEANFGDVGTPTDTRRVAREREKEPTDEQ